MTARERILMIRLMNKLKQSPVSAKALGVEAAGAVIHQNGSPDPKGLTTVNGFER